MQINRTGFLSSGRAGYLDPYCPTSPYIDAVVSGTYELLCEVILSRIRAATLNEEGDVWVAYDLVQQHSLPSET